MSDRSNLEPSDRRSPADSAPASAPSIRLHIEELTLHGFAPGAARDTLSAAIERELARLLAEQGLPPRLNRDQIIGRIDGGNIEITSGSPPDTIGEQIAEAVYRGLGR